MDCTEKIDDDRAVAGELMPPTIRINLSTAEDIRREMARVYREARGRTIDTAEASRLIYMLSQITKAYELGVIEKRLDRLEQSTK